MGFYERQRDGVAKKLIAKYGQAMTLRVITPGAYDPDTRLTADPVTTDYPIKGIAEEYKLSEVDGTVIQNGDKKILISASGLAVRPLPEHIVIMSGEVWQVINCTPLAPGGVAVTYSLQLRS
jgi:hypothetical protein